MRFFEVIVNIKTEVESNKGSKIKNVKEVYVKIDILVNILRKSDSTLARASARLEVLSEIKGLK